jgi:hypothetical protein
MKTLIILGLLALVFSYPSFLRELQEDPAVGTETPSDTVVDTQEDDIEFNRDLFSTLGVQTRYDSNCTPPVEGEVCNPSALVTVSDGIYTHKITYPDDAEACGALSGVSTEFTAEYYIGMFINRGRGSEGAIRINNHTIVARKNDTLNPDGGKCVEQWRFDDANDTLTAPTEKLWEGAWTVYKTLPIEEGKEDQYCCIPKEAVLVAQDLETETIVLSFRAPDCDACQQYRNKVYAQNISIVGGGGFDESMGVPSFFYAYQDHLVIHFPQCVYLLEQIPVETCNTTNTTVPDNESSGNESTGTDNTTPAIGEEGGAR